MVADQKKGNDMRDHIQEYMAESAIYAIAAIIIAMVACFLAATL